MAFSELQITPDLTRQDGDLLSFDIDGVNYVFTYKASRTSSFQIEISNLTLYSQGLRIRQAWGADLNASFDYTIGTSGSNVRLRARVNGVVFSNVVGASNYEIINQPESDFSVVVVNEFLSNSDTDLNNKFKYNLETGTGSSLVNVNINGSDTALFLQVVDFDLDRNIFNDLVFTSINGFTYSKQIAPIHILDESNLTFSAARTANGYTLSVFYNNDIASEYKLDSGTYQSSSLFFNATSGTHTVSVKDIYGGEITKTIEVEDTISQEPTFILSDLNSARFAKRVTYDYCNVFPNESNTLSCEEEVLLPKQWVSQFLPCDSIRIQFKSNYRANNVSVIEDGLESFIIPEQKTNFLEKQDTRDAITVSYGVNQTGVYFTSGAIYDYETTTQTGTYILNGSLPNWGVIGNFIGIDGNFRGITDIVYNTDLNVNMLIIGDDLGDSNITASCTYNLFDYEVYEFSLLAASYLDRTFQFKINSTDNRFEEITYLSEKINVVSELSAHLHIIGRNRTNTDIYYPTGIYHTVRAAFIKKYEEPIQESDAFKSDDSAYLIDSDNYKQLVIEFEPVTTSIMHQLLATLSSSEVFINGIGYVKNDAFEIEGKLEDSNLYLITAKMIRTGVEFSAQDFVQSDPLDFSTFEAPSLLTNSETFVNDGDGGIVNSEDDLITS